MCVCVCVCVCAVIVCSFHVCRTHSIINWLVVAVHLKEEPSSSWITLGTILRLVSYTVVVASMYCEFSAWICTEGFAYPLSDSEKFNWQTAREFSSALSWCICRCFGGSIRLFTWMSWSHRGTPKPRRECANRTPPSSRSSVGAFSLDKFQRRHQWEVNLLCCPYVCGHSTLLEQWRWVFWPMFLVRFTREAVSDLRHTLIKVFFVIFPI